MLSNQFLYFINLPFKIIIDIFCILSASFTFKLIHLSVIFLNVLNLLNLVSLTIFFEKLFMCIDETNMHYKTSLISVFSLITSNVSFLLRIFNFLKKIRYNMLLKWPIMIFWTLKTVMKLIMT